MRCLELDRPVAPLAARLLERGAYVPYRDNLMFICPPLCLTVEEAHIVADLIADVVAESSTFPRA
jgi:taurine--2-oxoglutarate transaminase